MARTTTIRDNGRNDWIKFDPSAYHSGPDLLGPGDCQIRFFDEDFGATIQFNPEEASALRDALTNYLEGK